MFIFTINPDFNVKKIINFDVQNFNLNELNY